jgi:hypothetical protein
MFAVFTPPLDYGEIVGMARAALDDVNMARRDRGGVGPSQTG